MVTIFSTPRPFLGPFDIIQRNAIESWLKLQPKCEVILFEDEEKTTCKVAKEIGIQCIRDVKCNEFGTPLLNDVFNKTRKIAKHEIIAQVNTDIILMNNFIEAVRRVKEYMKEKPFLMVGRRWDLDIKEDINFNKENWEEELRNRISKMGKLHPLSGMDYWIFPRNFPFEIPPFVVGRPGIDSWLIFRARSLKIPVIDATELITAIHQNHNYPSKKKPFFETEKQRNLKLAGGFSNMCTLRDADWILTKEGLKKPPFPRRIFAKLTLFYPWRFLLSIKRKLQRLA